MFINQVKCAIVFLGTDGLLFLSEAIKPIDGRLCKVRLMPDLQEWIIICFNLSDAGQHFFLVCLPELPTTWIHIFSIRIL